MSDRKRLPLDPILNTELRLGVMSILIAVECADFTYIREELGVTGGNLSIQLDRLVAAAYISIEKGYKGRRPNTTCSITEKGRAAFLAHVEALKSYF